MTVEESLHLADSGDRTDTDPLCVLADEVRRLRDILINPAALRTHVERHFPEYAWEHRDYVAALRERLRQPYGQATTHP